MKRRTLYLLLVVLLAAAGVGGYLYMTRDTATVSPTGIEGEDGVEPYGPLLEAREALLSSPHDVDLELTVDIPKNSESDNPDHQEIDAGGSVDFGGGNADLVYDFNVLANPAGFLGHFETMDVLYVDGTGYLDIFIDGPPWVSFEPEAATNNAIARLQDVLLTTPMVLPGILESAAVSPVAGDELSREIDPATLSESDDELASGVGGAFQELSIDSITVEIELEGDAVSGMVISFDYLGQVGTNKVEASYALSPTEEEVSVEAPESSDIRTFESIFD